MNYNKRTDMARSVRLIMYEYFLLTQHNICYPHRIHCAHNNNVMLMPNANVERLLDHISSVHDFGKGKT